MTQLIPEELDYNKLLNHIFLKKFSKDLMKYFSKLININYILR